MIAWEGVYGWDYSREEGSYFDCDNGVMGANMSELIKSYTVCIICQLYLNKTVINNTMVGPRKGLEVSF